MTKFILITLLFFSVTISAFAQVKRNSAYIEVGGTGGIYSLNYDRNIGLSEKVGLAPRVGLSWVGSDKFLVPIEANVLLGNQKIGKRFAEIGIGATVASRKFTEINDFTILDDEQNEKGTNTVLTSRIGYRHQKSSGGFMYRLGFVMFYNPTLTSDKFKPFAGVSVGYNW